MRAVGAGDAARPDLDVFLDHGAIAIAVDGIEARISHVESDVQHRATREEVHKLELSFTRMEGRFESIDQRTAATAHGVQRIESFMYEAAMRAKDGK